MESMFDKIARDVATWPEPYNTLLVTFCERVREGRIENYVIVGDKPGDQLFFFDGLAIVGLDGQGEVPEAHIFYGHEDLTSRFLDALSTFPTFSEAGYANPNMESMRIAEILRIREMALLGVVGLHTVESRSSSFATLWVDPDFNRPEAKKVIRYAIEKRMKSQT